MLVIGNDWDSPLLEFKGLLLPAFFLFFESEVMYQPSSIELYSMIIISSPIKLETEKGARESLKQECAASGQLIHRVN